MASFLWPGAIIDPLLPFLVSFPQPVPPIELGEACCPDPIETELSPATNPGKGEGHCSAEWALKIHAKWRDKGQDEEGNACKCSCCEVKQFVSTMQKLWLDEAGKQRKLVSDRSTYKLAGDIYAGLVYITTYRQGEKEIWSSGRGPQDDDTYALYDLVDQPLTVLASDADTGGVTEKTETVSGLFRQDGGVEYKRELFGPFNLPDALAKLAQQDRLAENDGERPDGRFREYWKRHAVFYGTGESARKTTEITPCSAKYEDHPNAPACTKQGHHAELSRTIVVVIRPKENCKGKPVGRICRFRFKCDWPIDAVACTQTEEGSGGCQGSCRVKHVHAVAAACSLRAAGLSVTLPRGSQLRMPRAHRSGQRRRARS